MSLHCDVVGGFMDMVLPALYLGCAGAERQYDELKRRGVTHVLQVRLCSHASGLAPVTRARRGVHCTSSMRTQ